MVRNVNVTLEWELYSNPEDVPKNAGIYMVISGTKSSDGKWSIPSYKLLDIGQSGESGVRLSDHDRKSCWEDKKKTGSSIIYKFAAMSSEDYDKSDRLIVECCLRANEKPPCGSECNKGYNRDDTVKIKNEGMYTPLDESYQCP